MDNVLVDFPSGIVLVLEESQRQYSDRLDEGPSIFPEHIHFATTKFPDGSTVCAYLKTRL